MTPILRTTNPFIISLVSCVVLMLCASRASGQTASRLDIAVDDPRPLAACIDEIERKFGWVVTYEDPAYLSASEINDVTASVRRDGKSYPRVLVPRGGPFTFSYALPTDGGSSADRAALLQALLSAYGANGNPGFFRVLTEGSSFHIVPTKVLNESGVLADYVPPLETLISLESGERTLVEVVQSIVAAVSSESGSKIMVGATPTNAMHVRVHVDGVKQRARVLLAQYLAFAQRRISWRLFYDPGMKLYVLNLHWVPDLTDGR